MPPLDDPTVAELIRALGSKLDVVGTAVVRLETAVTTYVTQEQRAHDKEIAAEQDRTRDGRIASLEERDRSRTRWLASVVIGPIIVGVLVWLLTKGQG